MDANYILREATTEQLEFLISLKDHSQIKDFISLLNKIRDDNMEYVFDIKVKSSEELAQIRASKKGEILAFKILLDLIKGAPDEIKRRKKDLGEKENLY